MSIREEIMNFSSYIRDASEFGKDIKIKPYKDIHIVGMGGSGIPGDILRSLKTDVPIYSDRLSKLPAYANKDSLVFVISYSGNTEEALHSYNDALQKKCQVVVITSGGKISQKAMKDGVPFIKIPIGIQPRAALPYLIVPILNMLEYPLKLDALYPLLEDEAIKKKAKDLAGKIQGNIPIIYSSENIKGVSYRWKTQFNENAKLHAFQNVISELNHNEMEGYENLNGDYYVIFLIDEMDSVSIKKRMSITKSLIKENGVGSTEIVIRGRNDFNRLMTEIYVGDLTSLFLAELNKTDPTQVNLIENFKKRLKNGY